ncbi:cytochrome C oxidase Cbb3 [Exiguobacterium sp. SH31]|uniref:menaquinol-cytochrome c reductase cytochrome b/c subunit n=1 Tax=unclassified Exiguobacterium TaxID=2644629 RepID=UPI0008AD3789|nr:MULTISPECIES: menaquinol-cytochrome c reductase cytochrome b/c subunit [unclassified Exiguobacterium]OGX77880.1 cytochrome C oxidase Cbb3 [Exiguobacterium sp. SH31]TCI71815.1 cytochrome C oxidase Cbb3 [Exiguobacterium sp. SH0S7]
MHRGKGMKFVTDSRVGIGNRKQNIAKDYSEYPGRTEAFWPNFLLKEWMVGSVFLIGFIALTIVEAAPLQNIADPTNTSYIPLPDWYFLFLYQLLKYQFAAGDWILLGTVILPGVAFTALLIAPWLDQGLERRPAKRPVAISFMLLGILSIMYLTWESVQTTHWDQVHEQGILEVPGEGPEIDTAAPGYEIYAAQSCVNCHGQNLEGGAAAPGLVGTVYTAEEIADIAVNGVGTMPAGQWDGSDEDLQAMSEFIASYGEGGENNQ